MTQVWGENGQLTEMEEIVGGGVLRATLGIPPQVCLRCLLDMQGEMHRSVAFI